MSVGTSAHDSFAPARRLLRRAILASRRRSHLGRFLGVECGETSSSKGRIMSFISHSAQPDYPQGDRHKLVDGMSEKSQARTEYQSRASHARLINSRIQEPGSESIRIFQHSALRLRTPNIAPDCCCIKLPQLEESSVSEQFAAANRHHTLITVTLQVFENIRNQSLWQPSPQSYQTQSAFTFLHNSNAGTKQYRYEKCQRPAR